MYNKSYLNKPFRNVTSEEALYLCNLQELTPLRHCVYDFNDSVNLVFSENRFALKIDSYLKSSYMVIPLNEISAPNIFSFLSVYQEKEPKYTNIIKNLEKKLIRSQPVWPLHSFPLSIYKSPNDRLGLSAWDPALGITETLVSIQCSPLVQRFLTLSEMFILYTQVKLVLFTILKNVVSKYAWEYMKTHYPDTCYQGYPNIIFHSHSYVFSFRVLSSEHLLQVKFVDLTEKLNEFNLDAITTKHITIETHTKDQHP